MQEIGNTSVGGSAGASVSDPRHIHIHDWKVVFCICATLILVIAEVGIFKVLLR